MGTVCLRRKLETRVEITADRAADFRQHAGCWSPCAGARPDGGFVAAARNMGLTVI